MITNRDEVLENALRVFAKMNYEKASLVEIAKACGLSKAGLIYYYPFKQDLFAAVIDKYIFQAQRPTNKFDFTATTFAEFIDQYVAGVEITMRRMVSLLDDDNNPGECSFNFYYYHLLMQMRIYCNDVDRKIKAFFEEVRSVWRTVVCKAKADGEIKPNLDEEQVIDMFHQMFVGLSFEGAFLYGLDVKVLSDRLHFLYSLIKA